MKLPRFFGKKRGHRRTGSQIWGSVGEGLFYAALVAAGLVFGGLLVSGAVAYAPADAEGLVLDNRQAWWLWLLTLLIPGALLAFGGSGLARVIRGLVLTIRKAEYITAAEALGYSRLRIIARHILPNTMSYVIVAATLSIPSYILGEVVLSFIGVGVQEPSASWGNMLNQARSIRALTSFPWLLYVPGAAIFLTVMAFNFFGDGLRDALDPRRTTGGRA